MTLITDPATSVELDVTYLSATIGAVINGLDVRRLDDATIDAIRKVWVERRVVFFPSQHLTPDEHVAFASRFGEPTEGHPVVPGLEGNPRVFEIDYTTAGQLYATYGDIASYERGVAWHTDVTFVKRPPLGSILRAVHVLAYLHAHSVKPEHTVRYHWGPGDIGFWDNRSTQHAVAGDFGDAHRVIQRVTLRGDEPR